MNNFRQVLDFIYKNKTINKTPVDSESIRFHFWPKKPLRLLHPSETPSGHANEVQAFRPRLALYLIV